MQKTALIAGATGLTGSHCLQLLLEDDNYSEVLVLSRKAVGVKHSKLQEHIIDFDRIYNYSELIKADDVFCCLGTTMKKAGSKEAFYKVDFTYVFQLADIAAKKGASGFFMVSAMGANKHSKIFYNKVKGEIEEAIKKFPFETIGIFRPSLLMGDRKEMRIGEKIAQIIMPAISFLLPEKYKPVNAHAVAKAMVSTALQNRKGIVVVESDEIQKFHPR